jgi:hypothetical protein
MALSKIIQDPEGLTSMRFHDGGKRQSATYTWFRGEHCNFGPTSDHLGSWQGYAEYFLKGLLPREPLIDSNTRITAFGSCFAANISAFLASKQYNVLNCQRESKAYIVRAGEGFVNSYSILQQLRWAFEATQPSVELWHGYDAAAFGYDESIRRETLAIFKDTDLFILTLGLSEVWYDKPSGEVFWRAIPRDKYDPKRHGFRTVSPSENFENIQETLRIIRTHRPSANIILTLSPIPLIATFRPVPAPVANSFSKASLRCALDRIFCDKTEDDPIYYWPSYEIVQDGFLKKWEKDLRHVKKPLLAFIMRLFEQHWCEGGSTEKELCQALFAAKISDGSLGRRVARVAQSGSISECQQIVDELLKKGQVSKALANTIMVAAEHYNSQP